MNSKIRVGVAIWVVLTLLLATFSSASASSDIQFLGARFIVGRGYAVTFKVAEDFDTTQAANLLAGGIQYSMVCTTKGESSHGFLTLVCLASVPEGAVGSVATITFGADTFTTTIKDPRPWCYSVFDYGPDDIPWGLIGAHCQVHTAGVGTQIEFYNPNYGSSYTYMYGENNPGCAPYLGNGYYYDC